MSYDLVWLSRGPRICVHWGAPTPFKLCIGGGSDDGLPRFRRGPEGLAPTMNGVSWQKAEIIGERFSGGVSTASAAGLLGLTPTARSLVCGSLA